jgi:hypothetical protein
VLIVACNAIAWFAVAADPLPDGRVLWSFQDLHFSNDNTLGATDAAHNAGLVQSGDCFTILGGRGRDFVSDALTTR